MVYYDPDTAKDPYAKGHYTVAERTQEGKSETKWTFVDDEKVDIRDQLPADNSLRYAVYHTKDTTKLLKYVGQYTTTANKKFGAVMRQGMKEAFPHDPLAQKVVKFSKC